MHIKFKWMELTLFKKFNYNFCENTESEKMLHFGWKYNLCKAAAVK